MPETDILENGLSEVDCEPFLVLLRNVFRQDTLNKESVREQSEGMARVPQRSLHSHTYAWFSIHVCQRHADGGRTGPSMKP